jgi:hypothetical protein
MQIRTDTNFSWAGNTYVATDYKTKIYENGLKVLAVEKRVYDINLYSSLGVIQQNKLSGSTIDLLV